MPILRSIVFKLNQRLCRMQVGCCLRAQPVPLSVGLCWLGVSVGLCWLGVSVLEAASRVPCEHPHFMPAAAAAYSHVCHGLAAPQQRAVGQRLGGRCHVGCCLCLGRAQTLVEEMW